MEERRFSSLPEQYRGRAALQRRVKPPKSGRASAPVVAFLLHRESFGGVMETDYADRKKRGAQA